MFFPCLAAVYHPEEILCQRLVDQFLNSPGGDGQVACAGIMSCNGIDGMPRIEPLCRFNNGRRLQIEGVVPDLVDIITREVALTNLELDDENNCALNEHDVDAASHSGNVEFEEQSAAEAKQGRSQKIDPMEPSIALGRLNSPFAVRYQCAQHCLAACSKERLHSIGVIRSGKELK
ncbi:MAG TPA: hypothetical protein PLC23_11305 [Verrucomicrobiota bacterium]|nr:hypothetical protein [Verrucomicrobiota bacterium]